MRERENNLCAGSRRGSQADWSPALDHRSRMGVATLLLFLSLSCRPHLYLTLASLDIRLSRVARLLFLALQRRASPSFSSLLFPSHSVSSALFRRLSPSSLSPFLSLSLSFYPERRASREKRTRDDAGSTLLSPMSKLPALIDNFGRSLRKCAR